MKEEKKEKKFSSSDFQERSNIFVGRKPLMNYTTGILESFKLKKDLCIKARGRFIYKAIQSALYVKSDDIIIIKSIIQYSTLRINDKIFHTPSIEIFMRKINKPSNK